MNKSIVIHGPQGCGKTLNAQRLARHFGLPGVRDEEPYRWNKPIPPGWLILTSEEPPAHVATTARVLSFAEAMREAGIKCSAA